MEIRNVWKPWMRYIFVASWKAKYFAWPGTPIPNAVFEYKVNNVKHIEVKAPHAMVKLHKVLKINPAIFSSFDVLDCSWVLENNRRQQFRVSVETTEYPAIAANFWFSFAKLKAAAAAPDPPLKLNALENEFSGGNNSIRDVERDTIFFSFLSVKVTRDPDFCKFINDLAQLALIVRSIKVMKVLIVSFQDLKHESFFRKQKLRLFHKERSSKACHNTSKGVAF